MFGKKPEIEFKAKIKRGASIGHDFGYFRWPDCKAPLSEGGGNEAKDPDMVFNASLEGNWFGLRAIGYGEKLNYGNGSIHVYGDVTNLIISDEDRIRILTYLQSKKQVEIDKTEADLAKLRNEKTALAL